MRHNWRTSTAFLSPAIRQPLTKAHTGRERGQFTEFHQQHDRSQDGVAESTAGVSEMPLARNEFGGQAADAAELLALLEVRRRVQPGAAVGFIAPGLAMKRAPTAVATLSETVLQLQDLILALDRRLPQVQRAGESAIANAALRLRMEASKRIGQLEAEIADRPSEDGRPVTF